MQWEWRIWAFEKPNYMLMSCFLHGLLLNLLCDFFKLSSWFESLFLFGELFSNTGRFGKLVYWFWDVESSFLRTSIVTIIIAPLAEASVKDFALQPCSVQSVQSLSRVRVFVTPWTAAREASLSITNSGSLLKLMSIELAMPSLWDAKPCEMGILIPNFTNEKAGSEKQSDLLKSHS